MSYLLTHQQFQLMLPNNLDEIKQRSLHFDDQPSNMSL